MLRAMRAGDFPAYAAMMARPEARFMGGPFGTADAWRLFCADHAQWSFYGVGALMLDLRATGACAGQVAINAGPLFPEHELGWLLYPEARGQGLAHEAARAMRDWGFHVRGLGTLVSYVDPGNLASCRLAERLGAWRDETATRPDPADVVYRHPRR
ncbi:GNAT family N-acetyltransferase [Paracoccus sp. p3-h83]|uniref:GNAT family N-acetyltransferase n=1 Tax=Paracoccus sp. p3-h83 TaxID=3342805 RepID=UPI0035BB5497